jgi:hypothetical protein
MLRRLFSVPGLAVFFLAAAGGCGSSGPRVYEVTGSVTLDNTPLPDGDITFFPAEKDVAPDGGKIKDGHFKVKVKEGKKQVVIQARRLVPGKTGPMGEPASEDYIPARYSDKEKTELTPEVGAGKTEHSFALQSK